MKKDLQDKTAIITGGASGIGKSTAMLMVKHGARVAVSDVDEEAGNKVVSEIQEHGGDAIFVKADVSKPKECEKLIKAAVDKFGSLDIAFNNAGIGGKMKPVAELTLEEWDQIIATNLSSVFYCMKYQIGQMLNQGKGSIINNSSILGKVGFANTAGYTSAKHGIIGLTQTSALEYSGQGIRINSIGPGFVRTPMVEEALDQEMQDQLSQKHPIGRLGKPEEIAELVVWLASDKASFVTGDYYPIDGGYLAQ